MDNCCFGTNKWSLQTWSLPVSKGCVYVPTLWQNEYGNAPLIVYTKCGFVVFLGPVKKITPVSAGEPTRISSSHKQLQVSLTNNIRTVIDA